MRSSSKKRNLAEPRQAWLDYLESKPNHQKVLGCFLTRGLATQDQIEKLTGFSSKQVRTALDELRHAPLDLPSLLATNQVNLQGQRGRPQQLHLLTPDGSAILKALTGESHQPTNHTVDAVELIHALIEMEVFTQATIAGFNSMVEKTLPFGEKTYIRADLLIDLPNGEKAIFEVEQVARINDVPRIQDKLQRLAEFFQSPQAHGIKRNIRMIFNLPANDARTLKIWRNVQSNLLEQPDVLPFSLYWQPALNFLQSPTWENLGEFILLQPESKAEQAQYAQLPGNAETPMQLADQKAIVMSEDALLPAFLKVEPANLKTIHLVFGALGQDLRTSLQDRKNLAAGRSAFFLIMRSIYEASHYEDGPVSLYAALPVDSLVFLHRYLNMHQNQELLEVVRNARDEVRRSQTRGVNLFRDTFTRLAWEFLRYHGFGRGGPLDVLITVPGFDADRSDIHVEVSIRDPYLVIGDDGVFMDGDDYRAEKALEWILNALWTYGNELELIGQPGKGKVSAKKRLLEKS